MLIPTPCRLFSSEMLLGSFDPGPPPNPPPPPGGPPPLRSDPSRTSLSTSRGSPPCMSFLNPLSTAAAPWPTPTPFFVRSAPLNRSSTVTTSLSSLAARSTPSFTTFASSAPVKPPVTLATASHVVANVSLVSTPLKCTARICVRPA